MAADNVFTEDEIDTIARFMRLDNTAVRGVGYFAWLKSQTPAEERCENCKQPVDDDDHHTDIEGVVLCHECWLDLVRVKEGE